MASSTDRPPSAPPSSTEAAATSVPGSQTQEEDTPMAGTASTEATHSQQPGHQNPTTTTSSSSSTAAAPASPPLPQRPQAVAPGPRASRFQDVLESSLRHTLGKIGYDNFAACFPTVAARNPALLRAVQSQMVERLGKLCRSEFESVLRSRSVVARLNELESLVGDAERRRDEADMRGGGGGGGGGEEGKPVPIWKTRDPVRSPIDKPDTAGLVVGWVTTSESLVFPHTLPPNQVLAAHLAPHLAQQQSQLNARLQTTQSHNARLWDEVSRQRAEIEALTAMAEKVLRDVDAASAMLLDRNEDGNATADELARETREVEGSIAT